MPQALTGAYDDEVPPVPIPNTVVKLIRAEDTWRVTAWENRSVPVRKKNTLCVLLFCYDKNSRMAILKDECKILKDA